MIGPVSGEYPSVKKTRPHDNSLAVRMKKMPADGSHIGRTADAPCLKKKTHITPNAARITACAFSTGPFSKLTHGGNTADSGKINAS